MLKKMKRMYPHQSLMMIFIIGLMTIAGSFIVEHVFKVIPCDMCLWQRYLAAAITVVAFAGTLFRGKIKKWFLATICIIALGSLTIGVWQSLSQRGIVELPGLCQAPEQAVEVKDATAESANLLANLEANETGYIDCSKIEDFFVYNYTGLSLANLNVLLMLFISTFSFYKLFFKPRRRYRRYNNNRNNNRSNNNNNRRYRGSGYRRSNNRNGNSNRRYDNKKPHNSNRRNNNEN